MEKIYDQAKDKNVAAVVIYADIDNKKVYKDPEMTIQMTTSELKDAFVKRALVYGVNSTSVASYFVPLAFVIIEGVGSINVMTSDGSNVSLASIAD